MAGSIGKSHSIRILLLKFVHIVEFVCYHSMVDGQAAAIHVHRDYNGRGIGKVLAKHLLRQIAELGFMNCITILAENKYSRNIFEPLGFKLLGQTSRVFTVPKAKEIVS